MKTVSPVFVKSSDLLRMKTVSPPKNENSKSQERLSLSSQEKLELGSWGLPDGILQFYRNKGINHMFEWQMQCLTIGKVLDGGNLVYSAPTSAGKTLVAEILISQTVFEKKKKALVILPFVSVVREKMFYFKDMFITSGIRVEGFMGGHSPSMNFQQANVAICTIEKANSLVNRLMEERNIGKLGIVVVDELHLLGDSYRGYLLELLLTKLKYVSSVLEDVNIQIVGMSATLPNLKILADWLNADLYYTNFRPVPLSERVKCDKAMFDNKMKKLFDIEPVQSEIPDDSENVGFLCTETIMNGHSVLIFCPTKVWCETLAGKIASYFRNHGCSSSATVEGSPGWHLRRELNLQKINEVIQHLKMCPVGLDQDLHKTVAYGVAFHHAGLTLDERDIIEGSFRSGCIRVLCATSTLSSGVNLPARRVIIRSPMSFGSLMDILTYRQMIGRAGRMGVDTEGESILICKPSEKTMCQQLLSSGLKPIESCLGEGRLSASLKRAILEVVASGVASSPEQVKQYAACTFLAFSSKCNMADPILNCIKFLEDNEFLRLQDGGSVYKATPLGQACLASSLPPDEGLSLFRELDRARRCFVLDTDLHIIYQVTPYSVSEQWGKIDWLQVLNMVESLPPSMRRVGELVGIQEAFLVKIIKGALNPTLPEHRNKLSIHRRFYTALALQDLVNEVSLTKVAEKFRCNKGVLQSLQQSAATYAGMVTEFTKRLGWSSIELIISQFQERLQFGIQRELCELMRLSLLNGVRARSLFNAGFTSITSLANANVTELENALHAAAPFQTKKDIDGETAYEAEQRKKLQAVWVTGKSGLTVQRAAELLVAESRSLLELELGIEGVKWGNGVQDKDKEFVISRSDVGLKIEANDNIIEEEITVIKEIISEENRATKGKKGLTDKLCNSVKKRAVIKHKNVQHNKEYLSDEQNQTKQSLVEVSTKVLPVTNEKLKESILPEPASSVPKAISEEPVINNLLVFSKGLPHAEKTNIEKQRISFDHFATTMNFDNIADGEILVEKSIKPNVIPVEKEKLILPEKQVSSHILKPVINTVSESCKELTEETNNTKQRISLGVNKTDYFATMVFDDIPDEELQDEKENKKTNSNVSSVEVVTETISSASTAGRFSGDMFATPFAKYFQSFHTPNGSVLNSSQGPEIAESFSPDLFSQSLTFDTQLNEVLNLEERPCENSSGDSKPSTSLHSDDLGFCSDISPAKPAEKPQEVSQKVVLESFIDFETQFVPDKVKTQPPRCEESFLKRKARDIASPDLITGSDESWLGNEHVSKRFKLSLLSSKQRAKRAKLSGVQVVTLDDESDDEEIMPTPNFSLRSNFSRVLRSQSRLPRLTTQKSDVAGSLRKRIAPVQTSMKDSLNKLGRGVCRESLINNSVKKPGRSLRTQSHRNNTESFRVNHTKSEKQNTGIFNDINIINVGTDREVFKSFCEEIKEVHILGLALGCRRKNEKKKPVIGSKLVRRRTEESVESKHPCCNEETVLDGIAFYWSEQDVFYMSMENCCVKVDEKIRFLETLRNKTLRVFDTREQIKLLKLCTSVFLDANFEDPKVAAWLLSGTCKEETISSLALESAPRSMGLLSLLGPLQGLSAPGLLIYSATSPKLRASVEALATFHMVENQLDKLSELKLTKVFQETEMPTAVCLAEMELTGFMFDRKKLIEIKNRLCTSVSALESKAHGLAQRKFSLSSSATVSKVLYKELGLGREKVALTKVKKKPSTSKEALQELFDETKHPLPEIVLKWRKITSVLNKVISPLLLIPGTRIHGTSQTNTATGRITMHDPNTQNTPRDFKDCGALVSVRVGFTAPADCALVSADYRQLELRLLAHLSGDENLVENILGSRDVFVSIAAALRGIPCEEVTDELRQQAKQTCYGMIYGIGARTLSHQLQVREEDALTLMDDFKNKYQGVKSYLSDTITRCRERGYVTTMTGRRRHLPAIHHEAPAARAEAERQAINTTVQGSAADLAKSAMVAVRRKIKHVGISAKLVLHLHDELLYEVKQNEVQEFAVILKATMENVAQLSVPLPVKVQSGQSWGTLIPLQTS